MLFQGFQVTGKVVPQNGGFVFVPVSYVNFQEESLPIDKEFPATYKGASWFNQTKPAILVSFP